MIGQPNQSVVQRNDYHAPGKNVVAVVNVAAVASEFWVLDSIHFGYDIAPGSAQLLTVEIGDAVLFVLRIPNDIAAIGPHEIVFPRGLYVGQNNKNEALAVTLSAGAGECKGTVNITYR